MLKKFAHITANTATDPGVQFSSGNTLLNLDSAGVWGLFFNLASIVTCGTLRARAELGHQATSNVAQSKFQKILNHRGTSLGLAGTAQLAVAAVALKATGLSVGAAIPFIFGIADILTALGIEGPRLDNIRRMAATKLGPTAATILTMPEVWFSVGLALTASSLTPALIFASAGALAVVRTFAGPENGKASPTMRRLHSFAKGNASLFMLMMGNFLVAATNAKTNPHKAIATGLFGLGFLSIYAANKCGGVAEAVRSLFKTNTPPKGLTT